MRIVGPLSFNKQLIRNLYLCWLAFITMVGIRHRTHCWIRKTGFAQFYAPMAGCLLLHSGRHFYIFSTSHIHIKISIFVNVNNFPILDRWNSFSFFLLPIIHKFFYPCSSSGLLANNQAVKFYVVKIRVEMFHIE